MNGECALLMQGGCATGLQANLVHEHDEVHERDDGLQRNGHEYEKF